MGNIVATELNSLKKRINDLFDQFIVGLTPQQFALQLNGVNNNKVNGTLCQQGWMHRKAGRWVISTTAKDKHLTLGACGKVVLTKSGSIAFYNLYIDGKLPMKSDWDGHNTHSLFSNVA